MALMLGLSKLVVLGRGKGMGEREERTISKREGREMESTLISYGEISVPGTQLLRMLLRGRSCTLRMK